MVQLNLLEMFNFILSVPYYMNAAETIFRNAEGGETKSLAGWKDQLLKDGYIPGSQYDYYVFNRDGIYGLMKDCPFLSQRPIYELIK